LEFFERFSGTFMTTPWEARSATPWLDCTNVTRFCCSRRLLPDAVCRAAFLRVLCRRRTRVSQLGWPRALCGGSDAMNALAMACLLEDAAVDQRKAFHSRRVYTACLYTPSYRVLTEQQRLRYNQLQALYFNEQIMFFEIAIGRNVLEALLPRFVVAATYKRLAPVLGGRAAAHRDVSPIEPALRAAILWGGLLLFYSASARMDGGAELGYATPSLLSPCSSG